MKRLLSSALLVAALLPLSAMAGTYTFTTNASSLTNLTHGSAVTWGLSDTNSTSNAVAGNGYTNLLSDINGGNKAVTSATLTLYNIWDWQNNSLDSTDALFVNILSGLNIGTTQKTFITTPPANDNSWTSPTNPIVNPFVDVAGTGTYDYNDSLQGTNSFGAPLPFNDATANSLLKANAADTAGVAGFSGVSGVVTWSDPLGGAARNFNLVLTFSNVNLQALNTLLVGDSSTGAPNVGLGFAAECHYYMSSATLSVTTATRVPDSGNTLALMGLGLAALAGFRRSKK